MNTDRKLSEKTKRLFSRYLSSMVNFYGRITVDEAFGIIQFQNDAAYNYDDFVAFIADKKQEYYKNPHYEDCFVIMAADNAIMSGPYVGEVDIVAKILSELQDKYIEVKLAQKCHDRYIPKKADLLRYVSTEYYEETPELRATVDWILDHIKDGIADQPTFESISAIIVPSMQKWNAILDPVKQLDWMIEYPKGENHKLAAALELSNLLVATFNKTRIWHLNGHTPSELSLEADRFGKRIKEAR